VPAYADGAVMANYSRKSFVIGDHLNSASGMSWTILWDTTTRSDGEWSAVRVQTEASAFESAAHFLKLGFVVHAIKDPAGKIAMNAEAHRGPVCAEQCRRVVALT
jgi:hypothetical protein